MNIDVDSLLLDIYNIVKKTIDRKSAFKSLAYNYDFTYKNYTDDKNKFKKLLNFLIKSSFTMYMNSAFLKLQQSGLIETNWDLDHTFGWPGVRIWKGNPSKPTIQLLFFIRTDDNDEAKRILSSLSSDSLNELQPIELISLIANIKFDIQVVTEDSSSETINSSIYDVILRLVECIANRKSFDGQKQFDWLK